MDYDDIWPEFIASRVATACPFETSFIVHVCQMHAAHLATPTASIGTLHYWTTSSDKYGMPTEGRCDSGGTVRRRILAAQPRWQR